MMYSAARSAVPHLLVQPTGNAVASQYILRHKNLGTTEAFYVKPVREEAVAGMKLIEAQLQKQSVHTLLPGSDMHEALDNPQ